MKNLIALLMLYYCSEAVAGNEAGDAHSTRGYDNITLCMKGYSRLTGEPIADEIDRVYIEVFSNLDVLAFTIGAVGTFGKRSPTYAPYLVCTVKNGEVIGLSVFSLEAPFGRSLVDDPYDEDTASDQRDEYRAGTVLELLYLRDDDGFEFCCSQPFDETNIVKHNPDLKPKPGVPGELREMN